MVTSDVVDGDEKCIPVSINPPASEEVSPSKPEVCSAVKPDADAVSAGTDAGTVASEEDDCVIVCTRDADERSDSGVSGVRSGGSASSVEEWRASAMAHGYGGGPPPPLLHLPPPPPALYAPELLWKQQRYQPPLHAQVHHAIADEYINATYDRERHHERLLRSVGFIVILFFNP